MTAVGLLLPKNPIVGFTGGHCEREVKPLLVVSADSRDSVERIRQTPSDESASRDFADCVCKIRSHERSVHTDALGDGEARHRRSISIIILIFG